MMNRIIRLLCFCLLFTGLAARAQKIATLQLDLNNENSGIDVPVHVSLEGVTALPDSVLGLYEVNGTSRVAIPYQIENKGQRVMYWLVKQKPGESKHRIFELTQT